MTDQRDRARAEQVERIGWDIVDCWYIKHDEIKANVKQRRELADLITAALADAERRGMERAAGIAMHVEQFGDGSNGEFIAAQIKIRDAILQAAGEVTGHAAVLADAERGVWEQMAKGLENHVVYAPSDEAYDNEVGKDGDGTSYNQGVRAAIAWIRAQATQEEGKQ